MFGKISKLSSLINHSSLHRKYHKGLYYLNKESLWNLCIIHKERFVKKYKLLYMFIEVFFYYVSGVFWLIILSVPSFINWSIDYQPVYINISFVHALHVLLPYHLISWTIYFCTKFKRIGLPHFKLFSWPAVYI